LADGERRALLDAGWQGRLLGPRILRVETAAIVGAAAALGIRL
jgi:16S rRNA U1498 N3-methylase RsmE